MDAELRSAFNRAYTPAYFARYRERLETPLGVSVSFRLAETPLFLPRGLRDDLATSARQVVDLISDPGLIRTLERAVPPEFDVPGRDELPDCVQVDFAVTRDASGALRGRLVELQGFPSLYAFTAHQAAVFAEVTREMPGLDRPFTPFFGGIGHEAYVEKFRRVVVGDCDPSEVVMLDLDPPSQKTYCDFVATRRYLGVDPVCPSELEREGRTLYRTRNGRRVPVRRIYNRVVFDELARKRVRFPFDWRDELDVRWVPHPNWYWVWSKYTLPFIDHPAVPRARFLRDVAEPPEDLGRYVLKPLFSFAGAGVKVDVTRDDLDAVPEALRGGYLLQEKVTYAPALVAPDGLGVKAEVRMMFLRSGPGGALELVLNLARLSRGAMLGVDQNRGHDWVGGSVGIWPAGEDGAAERA
ncbi:MAG TPA: hypothetical protein VFS43_13650 [Polyangiaceae bacterium]|nr:hypothetical protein [Polyangiaceae bacterium]